MFGREIRSADSFRQASSYHSILFHRKLLHRNEGMHEGYGVTGSSATEMRLPESEVVPIIPFAHPDVRALVDSMFLDGDLQPLPTDGQPSGLPDWAKVGVVQDPDALEKLVVDGVTRLAGELPSTESSHRDWAQLSRRLGEIIFRFHALAASRADRIGNQVLALKNAADERLRE